MKTLLVVSLIGLAILARPALAHHAFAAEYNASRQVLLTGSIAKVQWQNPHAHLFLDVRDAGGQVFLWDLELASPNTLERAGWMRQSLKVGEVVTVNGYLAKDGSRLAHARDIRLPDGRTVTAGPSQ